MARFITLTSQDTNRLVYIAVAHIAAVGEVFHDNVPQTQIVLAGAKAEMVRETPEQVMAAMAAVEAR